MRLPVGPTNYITLSKELFEPDGYDPVASFRRRQSIVDNTVSRDTFVFKVIIDDFIVRNYQQTDLYTGWMALGDMGGIFYFNFNFFFFFLILFYFFFNQKKGIAVVLIGIHMYVMFIVGQVLPNNSAILNSSSSSSSSSSASNDETRSLLNDDNENEDEPTGSRSDYNAVE